MRGGPLRPALLPSLTVPVHAVSKVFAMACEEGSAVNVKMFEDIFMEEDAFVFAHVCPPPPPPVPLLEEAPTSLPSRP